jgi:hypothetical protein
MKQKKDKTESIVFSTDESTEILFEKIKGWEITSQVKFAVSFDNPERKELFEKIFEAVTDNTIRQNISLIVNRIEQAAFQISGYTPSEIKYYHSLFAKQFCTLLHSENYQTYIDDKIRELLFYCKGMEQDLRTKQYEFLEDREQDKNQLTEAERYKVFLENLLIHLNNPAPQQTETKTKQQTENDFTLSTIEDWLFEFKVKMSDTDYQNLVSALIQYFETGAFPKLSKPIQINGRPNKKLFGWALNRIFEAKSKGVEKELLQFAKQNISLFTDVNFDENNILKSNLYKYFTTKTK